MEGYKKDVGKLEKEADQLAVKAENKNKLEYLAESNKKRKRTKDLMLEIDATKIKIRKLKKSHEDD